MAPDEAIVENAEIMRVRKAYAAESFLSLCDVNEQGVVCAVSDSLVYDASHS